VSSFDQLKIDSFDGAGMFENKHKASVESSVPNIPEAVIEEESPDLVKKGLLEAETVCPIEDKAEESKGEDSETSEEAPLLYVDVNLGANE
jgi:hypothetical protein